MNQTSPANAVQSGAVALRDEEPVIRARGLKKQFNAAGGPMRALDGVDIEVRRGQMLVLLGPSGCGKTTLLRCLAGLETPGEGNIQIAGQVVADPSRGIDVSPERRNLGMMFQSYALWPHMSVFKNVSYPLRSRERLPSAVIAERVSEVLRAVGLASLDERYPSELSGGQQQRVALARALVASPSALLFDEPLSNVDAQVRKQLRDHIRVIKETRGYAGVYVTHDQEEAMVLADILAVMRNGVIEQIGSPDSIYRRPNSLYIANFIGEANAIPAIVVSSDGPVAVDSPMGRIVLDEVDAPPAIGDRGHVVVRPEAIDVVDRTSNQGATNLFSGMVREITLLGPQIEVDVEIGQSLIRLWTNSSRRRVYEKDREISLAFEPRNASWVRK